MNNSQSSSRGRSFVLPNITPNKNTRNSVIKNNQIGNNENKIKNTQPSTNNIRTQNLQHVNSNSPIKITTPSNIPPTNIPPRPQRFPVKTVSNIKIMPEQLTNQIQKTNIDSQPIKKSYSFNTTNSIKSSPVNKPKILPNSFISPNNLSIENIVNNKKEIQNKNFLPLKIELSIEKNGSSPKLGEESKKIHNDTFIRILNYLFEGFLPDDKLNIGLEFISKIENQLKNENKSKVLSNKKTNNTMWKIIQECSNFLDYEKKMYSIVKIQNVYRGYKTRKYFQNKLKIYLSPTLKARNNVFRELLKSETSVIKKLEIVVGQYYLPLKESASSHKPIVTNKDISTMFSNIEIVLNFHRRVKDGFDKLRQDWPCVDFVGDIFLKLAPELKRYGEYVENFDAAINHIHFLKEQGGKFATFLNEVSEKTTTIAGMKIGLLELLATPLHQMNEYELKLEALVNNTPSDHPGYSSLIHAAALMKETNQYVKEAMTESTHRVQVLEIQRNLADDYELIKPKRKFENEWDTKHIMIGGKKIKKAHIFLFNDILLVANPKSNKYKIFEEITFEEEITIEDIPESTGKSGKRKNEFIFFTPKQKYKVGMATKEEKQSFFSNLSKIIEYHNNKVKVFGLPFTFIVQRDKCSNGIPIIVEKICTILQNSLDLDGIFRVSASKAEVFELMNIFDKGLINTVNLSTMNPHVLASLLKMYFRELPEPVFPFQFYDPLIGIADITESKERIEIIKKILKNIPLENIILIKYIINFLSLVAQNSSVNRMNESNLAIVFGPNLLRPKIESMESSINVPKVNIVIEDMIHYKNELFN